MISFIPKHLGNLYFSLCDSSDSARTLLKSKTCLLSNFSHQHGLQSRRLVVGFIISGYDPGLFV